MDHTYKKNLQSLRIVISILTILFSTLSMQSQITASSVSNTDIESASSLVSYSKDSNRFWVKRPPKTLNEPSEWKSALLIGKNNKGRTIYGLNETSIIEITLDKKAYSNYKNDKELANLKEKEWNTLYNLEAEKLAIKFQQLNDIRSKEIEDSIYEVRRLEELKRLEAARLEARRKDSIKALEEDRQYRELNPHKKLDISTLKKNLKFNEERELLSCVVEGCDYRIRDNSFVPINIKNDTLIFLEYKAPILDIDLITAHAIVMNDKFKNDPEIRKFLRAWGDSLALESISANRSIELINFICAQGFLEELHEKAPNGYVVSWSWGNEYGPVSLYVSFCNTNKKTIKYIKFFFTIYNDVGDVRGSGAVQGTGPVEELETGSWEFDNTGCWPRGDASIMKITKIYITYMNGSTLTLTGDKILFN